jgi:hypothetical protein
VGKGSIVCTIGGGQNNDILDNATHAVIGGGQDNVIGPGATHAVIAGGQNNRIETNAVLSVIGGGRYHEVGTGSKHGTIAGGLLNVIGSNASYCVVGGGRWHAIGPDSLESTIGGGRSHRVGTNAVNATIAGGRANEIDHHSDYNFIGGGGTNVISVGAGHAVIAGGLNNRIASNQYAAIGGGLGNYAGGKYAVVPGGVDCEAAGHNTLAAGKYAKARHQGSFVWADSGDDPFATTANDQFLVRASGGAGINTSNPVKTLQVAGDIQVGGTTTWSSSAEDRIINFGDTNYVYIGEIGGDDRMDLRAGTFVFTNGWVGIGGDPQNHPFEVYGSAWKNDGSTLWATTSDRRLKEDVREIAGGLDVLETLRPVSFRYNDAYRACYGGAEDRTRHGFVAQEYALVFPDDVKAEPATGYLRMDAGALQPHVVAAVKELHGMVRELKAENEALRAEVEALKGGS